MAIMYPDKPKEFTPNSKEDLMFNALSNLPDTYYVFHSFSVVTIIDNIIHESETDFVIFNPEKGILCLEAKAGEVKYEDGKWKYGNNIVMSHDGPFNQASSNKWKLISYIQKNGFSELLNKCKVLHGVWFPSVPKDKFKNTSLPPEADKNLLLTSESLENIERDISRIFDVELPNKVKTNLSQNDTNNIINRILAPSFNLVSLSEIKLNHKRQVFKKMLNEQIALLNYLEEQNSAIINGMAGTGKTVMAIEKAKRHAENGERVLFLCYNYFLKEYLKKCYDFPNVDYYTIDGLACMVCNTDKPDYSSLKEVLEEMYFNNTFPYNHIVIDEGQDFGRENIEEEELINLLKMNVLDDENKHGTFYMFYDKNQMIQSDNVPQYIEDADCKLTLYKNCRNTINIARTSLRLLRSEKSPKMYEGALVGESPNMYFCDNKLDSIKILNNLLDKVLEEKYNTVQILTCKTENKSILKDEYADGNYLYNGKRIPFTTCRKFKGLEAEVIILVDLDKEIVKEDMEQVLYVGASRAKYELNIIANLNENECEELLKFFDIRKGKNSFKCLATALNSRYVNLNME